MERIKILYFGHGLTGYYGIQRLMRGQLRDKVDIKAVIVSPRGNDKAAVVRKLALDYGIEVYNSHVHSQELADIVHEIKPDLGIVMNFDQKIPQQLIDSIPNGIWNVHPSDLPKYRGGTPLEYIVVNGDDLVVSVHKLTQEFDKGEIVYKSMPVKVWDMDIDELYMFSSKQSALALEEALMMYIQGKYEPKPQDDSKATYANASKLDELLRIDWQNDYGEKIYRKVLAGGVNRGAVSGIMINGEKKLFRITESNFIPGERQEGAAYGAVKPMIDGCYAANVIGGTLYFSIKPDASNSQIIHTLNRANELTLC